jgi:hypothetical protein
VESSPIDLSCTSADGLDLADAFGVCNRKVGG